MREEAKKSSRVRWLAVLVLVLAGAGNDPGASGQPPEPSVTHGLRVSRFVDAHLSEADVDAIVAKMGAILRTDDSPPDDVSCDVNFVRREGAIETFTTGDGVISGEDELAAVLFVPGDVKVVNRINWCRFPWIWNGCAYPGHSFIVTSSAGDPGIVWLHEFGHVQGLEHRPGGQDDGLVMTETISSDSRRVNREECDAYRMQ